MNIVEAASASRVKRLPWDLVTGFAPPKLRKCKHCEKRMRGGELWGHGLSAHAGKFKGFKRWLYAVEAKEASWAGVVKEGMRFGVDIQREVG